MARVLVGGWEDWDGRQNEIDTNYNCLGLFTLLGSGLKMTCEWRGRFRSKGWIGMKFGFSFLTDDLKDLLDVIFTYVCVYQWTTCAVVVK